MDADGRDEGRGRSEATGVDAEHLQRLAALRPEVATCLGLRDGLDALPDPDPAARGATLDALVAWRRALEQGASDGDRDRSLDTRVFAASLELLRFSEQRLQPHTRDPDVAGPVFDLLHLHARRDADDEEGAAALLARLKAAPRYLVGARAAVAKADPLLLERARRVAEGRSHLVKLLNDEVRARGPGGAAAGSRGAPLPGSLVEDVQAAARQLGAAGEEHARWLSTLPVLDEAKASIGADGVDEILRLRGLDLTAAEVLDLGKSIAEEMRLEERRLVRRGFKGMAPDAALAAARSATPISIVECMSWLSELLDQSRGFLVDAAAAPLVDDDPGIAVATMAVCSAVDGAAARLQPAPCFGPARPSVLFLAEPPKDQGFAELSVADLEAISARAGYPGLHLLAATTNRGISPARRGAMAGFASGIASTWGHDMTAGWGHYAEELMRELQFRDSPASKLIVVRNALAAALLAVADVCLGIGRFTPERAVDFLVSRGGVPEEAARARVRAMRRRPTAASSALVGKVRIEQLRREARKRWRQGYSDKRFHGLLLRCGPIPLAYLFELLDLPFTAYSTDAKTEDIGIEDGVIVRRPSAVD